MKAVLKSILIRLWERLFTDAMRMKRIVRQNVVSSQFARYGSASVACVEQIGQTSLAWSRMGIKSKKE